MAFVPAPNIVEVFLEFVVNGKAGIGWVLHYEHTNATWLPASFDDLGDSLKAWFNTLMKPQMHTSSALQRIRMRDLTTQNGAIYDYSDGLPIGGTLAGSPVTNNVAFSLKKNTGFAGKSMRGRIYQMGFVETDTIGNTLDSTRANAYVTAWTDALFFTGSTDDFGMVLVSKYSGGAPRATALVTDVTSISYADLTVDTRRDRL